MSDARWTIRECRCGGADVLGRDDRARWHRNCERVEATAVVPVVPERRALDAEAEVERLKLDRDRQHRAAVNLQNRVLELVREGKALLDECARAREALSAVRAETEAPDAAD